MGRKIKIGFCVISFLFLLSFTIIYGYRFVSLYLENKKMMNIEKNSLAKVVRENNEENDKFKNINEEEYFINDSDNNYLLYSNILWRIIKVNKNNSIVAISDNSLTSISYGQNVNFLGSFINVWLNKFEENESGILQKNLNNVENYLIKNDSCVDVIDKVDNSDCKEINSDNYLSLLSTRDFTNVGNTHSYIINGEFFYLNNTNQEGKIWYINDEGKLALSTGIDTMGVRPVITLKTNVDYVGGDGTKNNPYKIEKNNSLFGSYVKLDNDIWRVYQVNGNDVKLVLNDYLKINNSNLFYRYSYDDSNYNSSSFGSVAHFLNNDYLNSLSYKNKLKETTWANGFYNKLNNYDYRDSLRTTISSRIGLLSIGDIRLNNDLENYFTMTGTNLNGSIVYTILSNQKFNVKSIQAEQNIVPTICLDKGLFKKGNGTIDSPFEME